jgi:hypothetical protein
MDSTEIIRLMEVLNLLETSQLDRIDFTIDKKKCVAYKLPNIIRIDIKLK